MSEVNVQYGASPTIEVDAAPIPRTVSVNVAPVASSLNMSVAPVNNVIEVDVAPVVNEIEISLVGGAVGPQGPAGDDYFGVFFSDSTINRDVNGIITSIDYDNGVTVTFNRDVNGLLTSLTTPSKTKTLNRDVNGILTGITYS